MNESVVKTNHKAIKKALGNMYNFGNRTIAETFEAGRLLHEDREIFKANPKMRWEKYLKEKCGNPNPSTVFRIVNAFLNQEKYLETRGEKALIEYENYCKMQDLSDQKAAEKKREKELAEAEKHNLLKSELIKETCILYHESYTDFANRIKDNSIELLLTDPPYSTDIENVEQFAKDWISKILPKVKDTGRAFICIGAYPVELKAYLDILLSQDRFIVDNPLIWTYRNTLGRTPNMKYNLNYQVILHLYSENSPKLDTSITNEIFSVQDINAPDGRHDGRLHTWQKPDELARRLIKHTTKKGDTIIDPFACTGTFSIMAARMGRISYGCDISKDNLEIAEQRGITIKKFSDE